MLAALAPEAVEPKPGRWEAGGVVWWQATQESSRWQAMQDSRLQRAWRPWERLTQAGVWLRGGVSWWHWMQEVRSVWQT